MLLKNRRINTIPELYFRTSTVGKVISCCLPNVNLKFMRRVDGRTKASLVNAELSVEQLKKELQPIKKPHSPINKLKAVISVRILTS